MEVIHSISQGGDRSRNLIRRNGGFEVWQQGANFPIAALEAPSYMADGWYTSSQSSSPATFSRVAGLTNGSQWAAKMQRNSGSTTGGGANICFPFDTDELFPLLGKWIRVSWTAKAGTTFSAASSQMGVTFVSGTGPPTRYIAGSAAYVGTVQVFAKNVVLSTTPTRYEVVADIVVPTNARQCEVYLGVTWANAVAGADDSFYIDDVQVEVIDSPSQMASPFERMHFADELLLCQRHFYKTFDYDIVPAAGAGGAGAYIAQIGAAAAVAGAGRPMCSLRFPVPMRRVPNVQLYNPVTVYPTAGWDQVRNANGGLNHTAAGVAPSTLGVRVASVGHASGVAGQLMYVQLTADAGIT